MQVYPVFFHDWSGLAIRSDGHWWISPRQVSDHLGLSWARQQRKINGSNLREGTALRAVPSARGEQETLTLKLGYFGAWLLGIEAMNVPEQKRAGLVAMQKILIDALERQLAQQFGLPGMSEAEDFLRLPLPPQALLQMQPEDCRAAREKVLSDAPTFQAVRFLRVGLAASRVAPLLNRSVYWARQVQRHCRRIGLVPLTPRDQRLLEQPSLFGEH